MSETNIRVRALLAEYQWLVALVAVALVASGLWLSIGAFAAEPDTIEEERVVDAWSASGDLEHSAAVREENELFPVDERLENEPLYYERISPVLDGEYAVGYDGVHGEDVDVSLEIAQVSRAVDDEGSTYWQERETLASTEVADVSAGDRVDTEFSLNVSDLDDRIDAIEESLDASPGETESVLEIAVTYDGVFDGEQQEVIELIDVELEVSGGTYTVDGGEFVEEYEVTETVTQEVPPSTLESVGGPVATLLGGGLLAGLWFFRREGLEPTDAEREWLAYRRDRAEFEDLLVRVSLPEEVLDLPEADVSSLGELATFGIDVGSAIVEDAARGRYLVRHDGVLYVYAPPDEPPVGVEDDTSTVLSWFEDDGGDVDAVVAPGRVIGADERDGNRVADGADERDGD